MTGSVPRAFGLALLFALAPPLHADAQAPAATPPAAAGERVMLPAFVTPQHYRIDITPDAGALTFKGKVQIDVTVERSTNKIVLNSADVVIDRAAVSGGTAVAAIRYDEAVQTATLTLGREIKPGAYTLSLAYHGKIYLQASGLFALDYRTPKGKARALFTQFENSDARRFVPSWDEPARKATFELTVTVPAEQMAVSNMPVASTVPLANHLKRVRFAATPRMSSYLLFFALGDFERVNRLIDGVDVGIVVKRGDTASTAFALDAVSQLLPYYNSYFATPYPLPKLDLVAAPGASQFFGAMENWGAIFAFESDLLIDPRISTEKDTQQAYIVVAHEMAHQWFGDLVTMAWWDDLWLNEGFASWMENKVTDYFHPEWRMWLQALGEKQYAMQQDARDGTHPIITPVNDVLQASAAFDSITYLKGAAVIRMLESYVGEDAFRAGVRRYMHDHAYGNTVTEDLWTELDRDARRPITQIAHDFTLQAGVPMVSEESQRCSDGKTRLDVTQGHFAIDANSTTAKVWHVPAFIAPLSRPSKATVVSGAAAQTVGFDGCATVVINSGQSGYFRSHYSSEGLAAITAAYDSLSPDDQLGVLNDRSAIAYAGDEPMAGLLELTKKIGADAEPMVASALVQLLWSLDDIYQGLPAQAAFRAYARGVLEPIFRRVGWNKKPAEADNVALLRSDLIVALGDLGDPTLLADARTRFDQYVAGTTELDAGTRRAVLRAIAVHADPATWDQLHGLAKSAATEMERREIYDLLAAAQSEPLVRRALELAVSSEPPSTIAPEMINSASRRHPEMALDFAIAHWDLLRSLIEPTTQPAYVPDLLGNAWDLRLIDRLNAFADHQIPPNARQGVVKSEAHIRYYAAIRSDRLPEVDQWLKAQ